MALSHDDLKALARPFAFGDHEFTRGYVYISEEAITARIEEVDPSWAFDILEVGANRDKQVYVTARLTINGVGRCNTGMQDVIEKAGEPEKGATTDALKRCARLFGVGRYLLGAPKEGPEFKRWLADKQREAGLLPGRTVDTTTGEVTEPAQASNSNGKVVDARQRLGNGGDRRAVKPEADASDGDLRDKATATAFIQHWREQSLSDKEVLAALGVARLSEWTKGRAAADVTVAAWRTRELAWEATNRHFNHRAHFENWLKQQYPDGILGLDAEELIAVIEADREAQGKTDKQFASV